MTSCASNGLIHVTGVARVKLSQENYTAPQFYMKNYTPLAIHRKVAHLDTENEFANLDLKKIYFLTLWQQHRVYNKVLGKNEATISCPQFHNDLLSYQEKLKGVEHAYAIEQNVSSVQNNPADVIYYPVMSLPYEGADLYSYLIHKNEWEKVDTHIYNAMAAYQKINLEELTNLCETGSSDGLYVFQNLVTYYSDDHKFINSQDALHSILKVTPISNMLVLNSFIKNDYQVSWSNVQIALLSKLNVNWFKNYLYELSSMRKNKRSNFALKE